MINTNLFFDVIDFQAQWVAVKVPTKRFNVVRAVCMIHVGGAHVTSNTDNTVKIRDRITWTVAFLLLFCIVSFMVDYNDE